MKNLFFYILIFIPTISFSQDSSKDSTIDDLITFDTINNIDIFSSDYYNELVERKAKQKNITLDESEDYPRVFFTNGTGKKYLKIWGGPDIGYAWFFVIGYTPNHTPPNFGTFIDSLKIDDFVINDSIQLGESLDIVWEKAHLLYFRRFSFNGIKYFYFEKGATKEVPFTPSRIYFFKFKNDKLIEMGLGHGIDGVNTMLQPE